MEQLCTTAPCSEQVQDQRQKLKQIQTRVARRPLMMEQCDSMARARRRALFRVRNVLQSSNVPFNVDSIFRDQELDEMEKAELHGAASRVGGA
eukprot:3124866-Amphidinium_carterae.2